jgi:hypothetical protein
VTTVCERKNVAHIFYAKGTIYYTQRERNYTRREHTIHEGSIYQKQREHTIREAREHTIREGNILYEKGSINIYTTISSVV